MSEGRNLSVRDKLERMPDRIPSLLTDLVWIKKFTVGYDKLHITDEERVRSSKVSDPTLEAAAYQENIRSQVDRAKAQMKICVEAFDAASSALNRALRLADNRSPRENDPFPEESPEEIERLKEAKKRRQGRGEDVA